MKFRIERKLVRRQLAWETFVVGAYAATSDERMAILRTLCDLVETEAHRPVAPPNDGNAARALLPRLVTATRSVRTPYIEEALQLGEQLLGNLEHDTRASNDLTEALLGVLISVRVEDNWTDGDHFHWGHGVIRPESDRGKWIVTSCRRLWAISESPKISIESRRLALSLLSQQHGTLNYEDLHSRMDDPNPPDWSFLLREHLERARSLAASGALDISLWFALRSIWDWHAEYDDDADLKAIAVECERLFRADPVRSTYAALLLDDDLSGSAIKAAAEQLRQRAASEIATFFDAGCRFLVTDEHAWRKRKLEGVAWAMSEAGAYTDNIRDYVADAIRAGAESIQLPFAVDALGAHLQQLRSIGDDDALVRELRAALANAPDDKTTATVLRCLYQDTMLLVARSMRRAECDVIIEHLGVFDASQTLSLLGCVFALDAAKARPLATALFEKTYAADPFKLADAVVRFCCGFHLFTLGAKTQPFSQEDYEWLLEVIGGVPQAIDFSRLGHMDDVVETYPKFGIPWFVSLVLRRWERLRPLLQREREVYEPGEAVWVVTADFPLLDVVTPLAPGKPVEPAEKTAIDRLLSLREAGLSVFHYVPKAIVRLDPAGVLVPELVRARIGALKNPTWRDVAEWSDFASAFGLNSDGWRKIAIAACSIANAFDPDDAERVYSHLAQYSEGGVLTEERFAAGVDRENKLLDGEQEPALRPFWQWRVKCAEADLRREQGRRDEERRGRRADRDEDFGES